MRCGDRRGAAVGRGFGNSDERSILGGRNLRLDSFTGLFCSFDLVLCPALEGGWAAELFSVGLLSFVAGSGCRMESAVESRGLKCEYSVVEEPGWFIFFHGLREGGKGS